jgi:hypothetical protein
MYNCEYNLVDNKIHKPVRPNRSFAIKIVHAIGATELSPKTKSLLVPTEQQCLCKGVKKKAKKCAK